MIRKRVPDKAKVKSMLQAAEMEIKFIKTIKPTKESASSVVRNVYEACRMLGDALLSVRGKEATGIDHPNIMIQELFTLKVTTKRPIQILLNLKTLRRRVNYQGYITSIEEAKNALQITNDCFKPLLEAVKKECN
jgi:isopenicillin N synthase-like dioxygenase